MVPQKIGPLTEIRNWRQSFVGHSNRPCVLPRHCEEEVLVHKKVEDNVNSVALAEVLRHLLRGKIRLAHKYRIASIPRKGLSHLHQVVIRIMSGSLRNPFLRD